MKIDVINKQKALKISAPQVKKLVKAVLALENVSCDEVAIHFVDTKTITSIHGEFFNDPTPTDCISFPIDDESPSCGYRMLGEVFVCPQTAIEYASKHGSDPLEETTLYIVHGLLHLIGYDDIDPKDRKAMRAAEQRLMQKIKGKRTKGTKPKGRKAVGLILSSAGTK